MRGAAEAPAEAQGGAQVAMPRRNYNAPIPKPPGCDPSNPDHVRSATIAGKIRATNENKTRRRRHAEAMVKHERFAARHTSEQLFDAFDLTPPPEPEVVQPYSAEFMLAQRQRCRENMKEFSRHMHDLHMTHARKDLCEIVDIVGVVEFERIMRDVFTKEHPSIINRIGVALLKVKRRRETPITEHMDIVLALLEAREGEAVNCCELHRSSGDGMTREEMWQALNTLQSIDLVNISTGRHCPICDCPAEATWRATNAREQTTP